MNKADNCLPLRMMSLVATVCLILFASGCATRRVVRVVDENGVPVPNALVVFTECNLGWRRPQKGAGFADSKGEYAVKVRGLCLIVAMKSSGEWANKSLDRYDTTATMVLQSKPFTGDIVDYYLEREGDDVPEEIRQWVAEFILVNDEKKRNGAEIIGSDGI
jgi:hypothetical protein